MNPARSLSPALVSGNPHAIWVYLIAPVAGLGHRGATLAPHARASRARQTFNMPASTARFGSRSIVR